MKLKRNAPILAGENLNKKSWPFADMRVNDALDIKDKSEWPAASKRAHNFAFEQEPQWKMATKWLKKENFGRIRRIA